MKDLSHSFERQSNRKRQRKQGRMIYSPNGHSDQVWARLKPEAPFRSHMAAGAHVLEVVCSCFSKCIDRELDGKWSSQGSHRDVWYSGEDANWGAWFLHCSTRVHSRLCSDSSFLHKMHPWHPCGRLAWNYWFLAQGNEPADGNPLSVFLLLSPSMSFKSIRS